MRFCVLHGFIFQFKNKRGLNQRRSSSLITASSSRSTINKEKMVGSSSSSQNYTALERTFFTPVDQLEVLCELMVDFRSLADNGYDFYRTIQFQGWEKYFDRLIGPVFPTLVKEFWIHATTYPTVIISSVMGKKLMITEKIISQLIGYEHKEVVTIPA